MFASVKIIEPDGSTTSHPALTTTPAFEEQSIMADRDSISASEEKPVEYRDIAGFPGYRIGTDASVWSNRQKGFGYGRTCEWKPVQTKPNKWGYITVGLFRDKKRFTKRIARLMLEAFVGPCPDGMEACHFPDPSRSNNAVDNLMWGTPLENAAHRDAINGKRTGASLSWTKLSESDVLEIRRLCVAKVSKQDIADRFHVSLRAIYKIQAREYWSHV